MPHSIRFRNASDAMRRPSGILSSSQLARISRFFRDAAFRQRLTEADSAAGVIAATHVSEAIQYRTLDRGKSTI